MTKTFKELREVDAVVAGLYKTDPDLEKTKFGYAYKRFVEKNYIPTQTNFSEELDLVRINCAMENENTKEILIDPNSPRGYRYTKDGLLEVLSKERELVKKYNDKQIEIQPYFSAFVPELTEEQEEILKGLLIA